jgi:hypothetical protein
MDQTELHRLLSELHAELAGAKPLDAANRQLLAQLAADIETVSRGSVPPERYRTLRGRLADAAAVLETTHPKVTAAIERVIDTLAFFNL